MYAPTTLPSEQEASEFQSETAARSPDPLNRPARNLPNLDDSRDLLRLGSSDTVSLHSSSSDMDASRPAEPVVSLTCTGHGNNPLSSLTSSTTDLPLSSPSTETLAPAAANFQHQTTATDNTLLSSPSADTLTTITDAGTHHQPTHLDLEKSNPNSADSTDGGLLFPSPEESESSPPPQASPPPEGGLEAWLTVAGSFSITTAVYGLSNSVGVLQPFWARHQLAGGGGGGDRFAVRDVAWISGANIFLCLFLGVQVGPWFDRFGPRPLLAAGSAVYLGGLVALAFLPQNDDGAFDASALFALLMLLWGLIMGAGAALCCTAALSVLAHWFERRRGLAAGIVFVGSSVGGAVFPLVLRATLEGMGWAWSMRIVAFIVAVLLLVGNVMVRGRIRGRKGSGTVDFRCFRDWRFVWTTIGVFSPLFVSFLLAAPPLVLGRLLTQLWQ